MSHYHDPDSKLAQVPAGLSAMEKRALVARLLKQKAGAVRVDYPQSYNQRAMWFLHQFAPASPAYHVAFAARICSYVDIAALQRALQALVDRHPALRTTFANGAEGPMQRVFGYREVAFEQVTASNWGDSELRSHVLAAYSRPFDLEAGPVFRATLFSRAMDEHVLLIVAHHIIMDGWSIGILLREFPVLYQAMREGRPIELPQPEAQYSDYVAWQRALLEDPQEQGLWTYWQQELSGDLPVLQLPIDRPRMAVQSLAGASCAFVLDAALAIRIRSLARDEGVTLYTVLLAAFHILLSRYSGQEDILVGTPVAGRGQMRFTGVIGDFINMVVIRAHCQRDLTFREFLTHVRQKVLAGLEHQDFPFTLLVERLGLRRDASHSPIFQVAFDLQKLQSFGSLGALLAPFASNASVSVGGLVMEPFSLPQQEGQLDLTLQLAEADHTILGAFKYNTNLFEADTIQHMQRAFITLLDGIMADPESKLRDLAILIDPERRVGELTLLGEGEREQVVEWNRTQADYPQTGIHHLFEAQAAQRAEAVAVVCEGDQIRYGELNRRANQLARYLQGLGVGAESLVGVHMERSIEMVVALLAIWKAGGAYLPLDPAFPVERLAYMVEDAQVPVLITQTQLAGNLAGHVARVICIDADWPHIARQTAENLAEPCDPERLAYVLYTSGSTGRPKGVQVLHRGIANFLTTMRQTPGLAAEDVLLSVTTLSFDISVLELFLPLTTGARVVLASSAVAADGARLLALLQGCGATVMQATPTTWRLLLNSGWTGTPGLKILCGGEAMPGELAAQLLLRCASLWNMYGPTETTVWSTVYPVAAGEGIMPIGRPIANTQIYLLDSQQAPVPVGVPGELYIGGDGLARGYLNRPELTAEKFIPDPFSTTPGARLYRTGDLARYRPDGNLEFLGRIDHQVKIRGYRIELGEIEALLDQHPAVEQAVVLAREDNPGDKRLVAYLTVVEGAAPGAHELRAYLREKLPDYMVPAAFVTLAAFPLTPNGKIDRRSLPAPDAGRLASDVAFIAPRNDIERRVAGIWQDVLKLQSVGIHDNFFDLGGHSLLIVQVHDRIRESFETDLTVAQMFQYPTIEALASYLQRPQQEMAALQRVQDRARRQREALNHRRQVIKKEMLA